VLSSEASLVDLTSEPPDLADTPVALACAELVARTTAAMDEQLGVLQSSCERGRHRFSSPQGNWITDVLRARGEAEVAIHNKGGTRCDLVAGPLTRRNLFELVPFDNTLVTMTLDGAALQAIVKKAMEDVTHLGIEVSGMTVFVKKTGDGKLELDHIDVGGVSLDPARRYRVATNSFLARGGDGYLEFRDGTDRAEVPVFMRDLMEEEVRRVGSVRAPDEARIVVVNGGRAP
jgi:2',3'-cyclic-nucleotide 2'-phosphodiesterase (5'-nucleotidase family)